MNVSLIYVLSRCLYPINLAILEHEALSLSLSLSSSRTVLLCLEKSSGSQCILLTYSFPPTIQKLFCKGIINPKEEEEEEEQDDPNQPVVSLSRVNKIDSHFHTQEPTD